jgi:hypothetical protein
MKLRNLPSLDIPVTPLAILAIAQSFSHTDLRIIVAYRAVTRKRNSTIECIRQAPVSPTNHHSTHNDFAKHTKVAGQRG